MLLQMQIVKLQGKFAVKFHLELRFKERRIQMKALFSFAGQF